MTLEHTREQLLHARSVIISGDLKGFFLTTDQYTSILSLLGVLREVKDEEHE